MHTDLRKQIFIGVFSEMGIKNVLSIYSKIVWID